MSAPVDVRGLVARAVAGRLNAPYHAGAHGRIADGVLAALTSPEVVESMAEVLAEHGDWHSSTDGTTPCSCGSPIAEGWDDPDRPYLRHQAEAVAAWLRGAS